MKERTYLDFDLLVEPASASSYRARVLNSPVGESRPVPVTIPFSDLELENFLLRIGRPRRYLVRSDNAPEATAVREFGGRLFKAVFHDQVLSALNASRDQVETREAGLRVRLRMTDSPELADLPWEYLYDGDARRFLALSEWTPVVRYLDLPGRIRPLPVHPPLRILVVVASPTDFPPLDVDAEWARLQESLRDLLRAGRVSLERAPNGTMAELQRQLRRGEHHVFHYIGHGVYDSDVGDGLLAMEGPTGRAQPISGSDLGALLHDHRTLRLALLNSCEGARGGRTDPYSGTAQSLVYQGIPAVVAMQFEITDRAAIVFTRGFYEAVADGYPLDAAMAEARKSIRNQPNQVEWGTPVLYMRAPDGRIFEAASRIGIAGAGTPEEVPAARELSPASTDLAETKSPGRDVRSQREADGKEAIAAHETPAVDDTPAREGAEPMVSDQPPEPEHRASVAATPPSPDAPASDTSSSDSPPDTLRPSPPAGVAAARPLRPVPAGSTRPSGTSGRPRGDGPATHATPQTVDQQPLEAAVQRARAEVGPPGREAVAASAAAQASTKSRPEAAGAIGGPPMETSPSASGAVSSSTVPPPPLSAGRPQGSWRPVLLVVAVATVVALISAAFYLGAWLIAPTGQDAGGGSTPSDTSSPGTSRSPAPSTPPAPPAPSVPIPSIGPTIAVGETPGFVVASPNGRQLYVANRGAGMITVVDTAVNQVSATIPVPAGPPHYLAFSPDGRTIYVSVWDEARTVAAVCVLDTRTNAIVATVHVRSRPFALAVTPDGKRIYVPNHDSDAVSVIDTATNTLLTDIPVPPNPHWVEVTPDGTRAYVANHDSNVVSVIDTATNTVMDEIPVEKSPHSVAVHRTRPLVANVNYDADSVTVIDTNINEVIATVAVGDNPQDITWAADGRFAYVTNVDGNTVSVISAEDFTVTATIPTGDAPTSIAVLPDGSQGYVSNLKGGTLTVLNLAG